MWRKSLMIYWKAYKHQTGKWCKILPKSELVAAGSFIDLCLVHSRPPSPVDAYITEEEIFLRRNPGRFYDHETIRELQNIYLQVKYIKNLPLGKCSHMRDRQPYSCTRLHLLCTLFAAFCWRRQGWKRMESLVEWVADVRLCCAGWRRERRTAFWTQCRYTKALLPAPVSITKKNARHWVSAITFPFRLFFTKYNFLSLCKLKSVQ